MASKFGGVPVQKPSKFGGVPVQQAEAQPQPEAAQPQLSFSDRVMKRAEEIRSGLFGEKTNVVGNIGSAYAGVVEPALAMGTGMVADTVGSIGGGIQAVLNPNDPLAGPESKARIGEALTYQPRTESGQRVTQGIGEAMQPVGEFIEKGRLGDEALEAGYPESVAKLAEGIPEFAGAVLAPLGVRRPKTGLPNPKLDKFGNVASDLSKEGLAKVDLLNNPQKATTAGYKLSELGAVVKDPVQKAALGQGWTKQTVAGLKHSNAPTKAKVSQMADLAGGRSPNVGDFKSSMNTRPSDILGGSMHDRYQFIDQANKSSGKLLGKIAQDNKKTLVNIDDANKWMFEQLKENGITATKGADGKIKVDFSKTDFPKTDWPLIEENINHIARKNQPGINFYDAHKLKQIIRRSGLQYETTINKAGASDDVQNLFKGYSGKVDEVLDTMSDAYDKQNIKFKDTVEVVNATQKLIKNNIFLESAPASMGRKMRGLTGNPEYKDALSVLLKEMDTVSAKYGGNFPDDLYLQQFIANEMDDVLNVAAKTSIKGELGRKAAEAASRSTASNAANLLEAGAKITGIKSEAKALGSLKALTR